MNLQEYLKALNQLIKIDVENVDHSEKADLIRKHIDMFQSDKDLLGYNVQIVPFVPGRRSFDEALYPGLGSSEDIALYSPDFEESVDILYRVFKEMKTVHHFPENAKLYATISLLDHKYKWLANLPGWHNRSITPSRQGDEVKKGMLNEAYLTEDMISEAYTIKLPTQELYDLVFQLNGHDDYFGFASMFFERFKIQLDLEIEGAKVSSDFHYFEVYNEPLFGSLYKRIVEKLVAVDVKEQLAAANHTSEVSMRYHPWFPVLCIGTEKAHLYMKAIYGDIVENKRMLTDPGWLLRVGLYLELLTCLGVIEVVKKEGRELLTPEERDAFDNSEIYKEIRERIDVDDWKKVWNMRGIALNGIKYGDMPVAFNNLLKKKAATLGFLHAHHDDLKEAIELAGVNIHNSQETWHRVFRDAERAVLKMDKEAFPELGFLSDELKKFVLWHETGNFFGFKLVPKKFSNAFGDQDGLYLSACKDYRASMNEVAEWARKRGLMEYTGDECVPVSASILENYLADNKARLKYLQNQDGYVEGLQVKDRTDGEEVFPVEKVYNTLKKVSIFKSLFEEELQELSKRARPIELGHLERIIVQGREGSSLFVLHDGNLEVVAHTNGHDHVLANLEPGAVVGEFSFLTGEKRTAAVRAIDFALVIEVSAANLKPLIKKRPGLLNDLSRIMEERKQANRDVDVKDNKMLEKIRATIFK